MNAENIKKYIELVRGYIKKAVEFSQNTSVNLLEYSKSIMKSSVNILNNLMGHVVKSQDPKVQALKTTLSALILSAGAIYAGIQVKQFVSASDSSTVETQQTEDIQSAGRDVASESPSIVSSYNSYKQCKSDNLPNYINVSMTWGNSMTALEAFKALTPPSVIVTAAGNQAGAPHNKKFVDENKVEGSKQFSAIIVGSVDPYGDRSVFSQQSEEVAIMAPGDESLVTTDENGNSIRFGGTSGSTALVTGALTGFSWLSGYQPTAEEAKILLEKTAIPLKLSNEEPQMNGPGMLNAYKLGMVAERLKELCGEDINCFKLKLEEDSTYQFEEDERVLELVELAFPECSADKCLEKRESCQDVSQIFERLRKAAFLNPENKDYWRYLSCVYASSGFPDNAKGMRNIYNGLLGADPAEMAEDRVNTYVDQSCQVDSDCSYVPKCLFDHKKKEYYSHEAFFTPANKDYITECQGSVLCEGACRCGSDKRERDAYKYVLDDQGNKQFTLTNMRLRCVDSQCVEEEVAAPSEEEGLATESREQESLGSTSGQR